MKLATLATIAASLAPVLGYGPGEGPDWATYTKNLPQTTVTVTRYEGTSTFLEGPAYNTHTIIVSSNGKALYTEIITGHNNKLDAPQTEAAPQVQTQAAPQYDAGQGPDWATYTKNLRETTVVVTRYLGTSTFLEGPQYNTETIVVSSDGKPLYTEIITGHNNHLDPVPTAAPQAEEQKEEAPVETDEKTTETTETTETTTESTEKSVDVSSSTASATKFGYFLGFAGVLAGAFFYFRKPKNFVQLSHEEV